MVKTGTKTLQLHLFGRSPTHLNLSCWQPLGADHEHVVSLEQIARLIWAGDEDARSVLSHLRDKAALARDTNRTLVWSDERLTYVNVPLAMQHRLAARLRDALPDARILITIRSQVSILASAYRQSAQMMYAALGWPRDVPPRLHRHRLPFVEWVDALIANPDRTFLSVLDYDRLVEIYASHFGAERISVLPMEAMSSHGPALAHLLGMPEASATAAVQQRANEQRSKITGYRGGWPVEYAMGEQGWLCEYLPAWRVRGTVRLLEPLIRRMPRIRTELSAAQRAWLIDRFAIGNRKLASERLLPLEQLRYPW